MLAEKKSERWTATVRCESARNVIVGGAAGPRAAAFSARVVFMVEGAGDRRARTILPGGMMDDDDQPKLDATCRRQRAAIELRETSEGTVFAANIDGQAQSAVILRAPNGALFASMQMHRGSASEVARQHPSPLAALNAMLTDGALRDAANAPAFDAIDDGVLRANRESFLRAAEQCNAPTALVERLVRLSADETADRLFEATYVRGRCSRTRLALETATRDLAAPRVRAWIEAHGRTGLPWPAGIVRYAEEHGLAQPDAAIDADAAADSAATTATPRVDGGVRR